MAPESASSADFVGQDFCYLTTRGRTTGRPHTIEIWFASDSETLYLIADSDRADWVRNLVADPSVEVRISDTTWKASARVLSAPEERDRGAGLVYAKYQPGYSGDLSGWRDGGVVVSVTLSSEP